MLARQFEDDLLELGFPVARSFYVQGDAGWMLGMYLAAVMLAAGVSVEGVFGPRPLWEFRDA